MSVRRVSVVRETRLVIRRSFRRADTRQNTPFALAEGVVEAAREVGLAVPLVVRMEGTNVEAGKRILAESGLDIISAADMREGAEKAVAAAGRS